jgi:hypothetical protein
MSKPSPAPLPCDELVQPYGFASQALVYDQPSLSRAFHILENNPCFK